MDAQAVSAALTPAALAPRIAKRLGLPPADVEAALGLLAQGSQPAFIARYRGDRVQELGIADLEQVQAAAAHAVAFELRRQQVAAELAERKLDAPYVRDALQAADDPLDLEDVRTLGKRKRRAAASRARIAGLTPLCLALWQHGSTGAFSDGESIPAPLLAVPKGEAKKRRRRRKKKTAEGEAPPVEASADGANADEAQADGAGSPAQPPTAVEDASSEPAAAEATEGAHNDATASADDATTASADDSKTASADEASAADATPEPAGEGAADGEAVHASPDASADAQPSGDESDGAAQAEPAADAQTPDSPPPAPTFDGVALAAEVNPEGLPSDAAALEGARAICAEFIAEHPGVRRSLRRLAMRRGKLRTRVVEAKKDKAGRYGKFFDRAEGCSSMAPTNVLAIHRGERDGLLNVSLDLDVELVIEAILSTLKIGSEGPAAEQLKAAALEAWEHGGLGKAVFAGVRRALKERADRTTMGTFCEALRPQLLAPAFGHRPLLAIDPGTQNGCRLVALDGDGKVSAQDTVFPLQPKLQLPQAKARIAELCEKHAAELVVVVSGSAAREVEKIARAAIREAEALGEIPVHSADADAIGGQAGSKTFKAEFPKADAGTRRAIAAGRRVQDPLTALAKADPRKLSLGQHQHDVDQESLRQALDQVVGTCIAKVSVDLNRVDADTLARLPGMSHALAKAVISFRESRDNGFRSRNELLEVPGMVGKAFEQSSGFLRVEGGDQPLDATSVHPERYGQVTEMARAQGTTVPELIGDATKIDAIEKEPFVGQPGVSGEPLGVRGLSQIQAALRAPGRDPRPPFQVAAYHPDLGTFDDLKVGMELEGIVTHIAGFGAFVDVGIPQEALVHLSELSHDYVATALDVVHIGQRVKGKVIEISPEKKRFALSLKALEPKPERPPRERSSKPRRYGGGRGKGKGGGRDRGGKGGGRPQTKEKALNFRLDLSDLAARLKD